MRLFVFFLFLLVAPAASHSQPVPDLGPEADTPLLDDLDTLPEAEQDDTAGKTVADGATDAAAMLSELFQKLAVAKSPEQAESIAQKIQLKWLESGSDTVDVLMARTATALRSENYGLALDLLDVIVTLKPDFAEGWNRRATVYYMQEDYGRSLTDIERTLALEPRHWGALSGLAIIQRKLGDQERALSTFRRALDIHPGLKNAREAVEAMEKAAEGEAI